MLAYTLKEDERISLYNNIRNRMEREFFSSPRKAVCDELLSVLADKKVSPSLDGVSTEEIVQKLRGEYSPNTAYILYNGYLEIDQERFLPYCPMIASHLLCSTYSGCWRPLFLYFTKMTHGEKPEEDNYTIRCLYLYCMEHGCRLSEISGLQSLIFFLKTLLRKRDIYQWVDEELAEYQIHKMLDRIDEIQIIEAQAIFNQRKWSRYGILSYVKFLLNNNMMIISIYKDDEYSAMSSENKLAYCKTFFSMITPFVKDTNGVEEINPIYMDMLDFFLENKSDIQNVMEEYSGLQKIGKDAIEVVRHLFSDQKNAEQVIQMIKAYIQTLDARDLARL